MSASILANIINRASWFRSAYGLLHENPGEFWHRCLFGTFWLSLASFPIGYGAREVLPLCALVFLLLYYRHAWNDTVLRQLKVSWLFLCVAAMILIGVIFSINPFDSLLHVGTGINKAFILPFIGMESVRNGKDLRCLVWASVLACFWQGLDGVWQAATGYDLIMGYPLNAGRLTGSLGDYTVGNYIALALVPAFGVFFIIHRSFGILPSCFIFCAFFWPAFFLLQGASSRSSVLAIAGALALWGILRWKFLNWRVIAWPIIFTGLFILCQPLRLLPNSVLGDARWNLWNLAWKVFLEHPWFGAGAGQYNSAFLSLGLAPEKEVITISHPHNLYLDMLYAHGLIGFCLGMIFLAGFLVWGFQHIKAPLQEECASAGKKIYWHLAAWFWLGYAAWLVNGIFGHDFYRIWWLALAMSHLGVMIGAVVSGHRVDCANDA